MIVDVPFFFAQKLVVGSRHRTSTVLLDTLAETQGSHGDCSSGEERNQSPYDSVMLDKRDVTEMRSLNADLTTAY